MANEATITRRPPFLWWVLWAPALGTALVVGLGSVLIDLFLIGGFGATGWFVGPTIGGFLLGYGVKVSRWWLPVFSIVFGALFILGLMSMQLAGVFCAIILSGIILTPVMIGAAIGAALRGTLKETSFSQRSYLPVLVAGAVGVGASVVGHGPTSRPIERVRSNALVGAPASATWDAILFYEEVDRPPPFLLRVGLARPLRTLGQSSRPGDVKVCVYNKGHITKRVVAVHEGERLEFEILEQDIGYERDVRLTGGSFVVTPAGDGAARVTLTTEYEPRLSPRWLWRPAEQYAIQLLHGHVLDGMAHEAQRSVESTVARTVETHATSH